jgi:adenine phosphoribosyltransferase
MQQKLSDIIRTVPDFPKPGIMFKDITPLLENPTITKQVLHDLKHAAQNVKPDAILGVESRGFLFGMPLALELNIPFITVRKKGKLPWKTVSYSYALEYGVAEVEMHIDSVKKGMRVLIHDDLLATGGTAAAAAEMVKMQGGTIAGFAFIVELGFLAGRQKLKPFSENIINLVAY